MTKLRGAPLAASLAAVLLLLSGCGGSGEYATSDSAAPAAAQPRRANSAEAGAGNEESARLDSAPESAQNSDSSGSGGDSGKVEIRQQDRAIIYTGEMTVRAKDVPAAADTAKQIVAGAGGRLASEESTSYGSEAGAVLAFKIPPERYQTVVDRLGKDLGKRESLRQSTEDVTEQVADVESRLKSSRSALDQLRTLLSKAKTIGEVLSVEREISGRQADLESLQARQKALAAQTAEATLTLRLVGAAVVLAEPESEPPGFLSGLKSGWRALVSTVKVALTVIGVLVPWLLPLGLLWLAYLVVRRRLRAGRTASAPPVKQVTPDTSEAPPAER